MLKINNLLLLSIFFAMPVRAVEIINNTSKNITIHDVSFTDGREIWMFPFDIKPGEKKIKKDFASFHANVPGVEGTYTFKELDGLACESFVEFDNKVTVIESKENQNEIQWKQIDPILPTITPVYPDHGIQEASSL